MLSTYIMLTRSPLIRIPELQVEAQCASFRSQAAYVHNQHPGTASLL